MCERGVSRGAGSRGRSGDHAFVDAQEKLSARISSIDHTIPPLELLAPAGIYPLARVVIACIALAKSRLSDDRGSLLMERRAPST